MMNNIAPIIFPSADKTLQEIRKELCQAIGNCGKSSEAKGTDLHQNLVKSYNQHWFMPSQVLNENGTIDMDKITRGMIIQHNR
eukprot:14989469-Ditylum_brightwellii.AAC.1